VKTADYSLGLVAIRQALAGALAGMLVFLMLERDIRAAEMAQTISLEQGLEALFASMLRLGLIGGGVVTGLLTVADELSSGRLFRIFWRGCLGALAGALLGVVSSVAGNLIFCFLGLFAALLPGGGLLAIIARTTGWALFGLGVGLSAGLLSRSGRRIVQGCYGGLIGGAIGGLLFDMLANITDAGTLSRLVGFTALGACIGLATAVAEQLAKVAWLVFLTGSREGRQVLLHRDSVTLGRDELVDVPLFGDHLVERRHAVLSLTPTPMIREVGVAERMRVNGQPVREAPLGDGSLIEIGKHRFRFHHRHLPSAPYHSTLAPPAAPPPPGITGVPGPLVPSVVPDVTTVVPVASPTSRGLALRIVAGGPSTIIPLEDEPVTLGRETGNTVLLTDGKVSRFHARIEKLDGAWMVVDLGSTNGVRINGLRVTRAGLAPGDWIYLGDAVIAVEPA
jgi:pSer/pThr/pTyr-binding forkhead associated (FHA) protein